MLLRPFVCWILSVLLLNSNFAPWEIDGESPFIHFAKMLTVICGEWTHTDIAHNVSSHHSFCIPFFDCILDMQFLPLLTSLIILWFRGYNNTLPNFGLSGDLPVTGDWNNDGKSEIGVFRNSTHTFYLDYNANGVWNVPPADRQYNFGLSGDLPISGDWNNDRKSEIGVYRNSTKLFYLDYNGNGVWNGSVVDRQYNFSTISGDKPISGKWS